MSKSPRYEVHSDATYPSGSVTFLMPDETTWTDDRAQAGTFTRHKIRRMYNGSTRTLAGVVVSRLDFIDHATNQSFRFGFS